ncbi:GNAT family N-acetyltransferase [Microvirga subterranea]|uniref:L-amino acid N-acyltransferase YncA n=1 Tax=Microvirga subterranea TaxID=186651 RepID=A0A370HNT5_9HYPH|nr:GNAT family N-acetyltransferase [Microvirga subterranea]RDI60000.1 L-amino acid N-acyltransferase YncA [Microvirga subterranea]
MNVTIRPARPADGPAIAALHFRMWRETYRDLAPEDAHRVLTEPVRASRWQAMLAGDGLGHTILVAEGEGRLAGFGAAGPSSHDAFEGRAEVKFLYVDRAFKRRGIGRILLGALASDMMGFGYHGIALGVVAGNDPAIAFYESMGGRRVGAYTDPGPVWRSENFVYAWDDLEALVARSPTINRVPKEA